MEIRALSKFLTVAAAFSAVWLLLSASPAAAQEDPRDTGSDHERIKFESLIAALESAKLTLRDAIAETDQPPERPIAARFFLREGRPMIEVVTAGRGYYLTADENILQSRTARADTDRWRSTLKPMRTVPDVARAAMYLTLIQTSPLTLKDFVDRAEAAYPGTVIAVVPESPNLEPSVEVPMYHDGELWEIDYSLAGEVDEREREWPPER